MGLFDFNKRKANQLYEDGVALYRESRREDARDLLGKAAELGSDAAATLLKRIEEEDRQLAVQKRFYQGIAAGKAKDYKSAFQILLPLAQGGHAESQYAIAMLYRGGGSIERNLPEARSWAAKAAQQGHEKADIFVKQIDEEILREGQMALIVLYNQGVEHHEKKDYDAAYNCFYEAASKGLAEAQKALALMYWNGTCYHKDFELVQIWLQKAIDQGLEGAEELLIDLRFQESEILLNKARKWHTEGCGYNEFDSLCESAKLGNCVAKFLLALKLEIGEDCHKDVIEAHRLYLEAAADGVVAAQLHAARLYFLGYGLELDFDKAKTMAQSILYNDSSSPKDKESAAHLLKNIEAAGDMWVELQQMIREEGMSYTQALFCDHINHGEEAFGFYYKSAEDGNAKAQYEIAFRYMKGDGVKKDYGKALHWFRASAEQGYEPAKLAMHDIGNNLESAAKQEEIDSCVNSGVEHLKDEEYMYAFSNFLEAAELGDMESQYVVAEMYYWGKGVLSNTRKALHWYLKAAEQGHDEACHSAALMLYTGKIDVKVDYVASMKWAKKGVELGNASCHGLIGAIYLNGNGVPESRTEAIRWFQKGAALGDEPCIKALNGLGVPFKSAPAAAPAAPAPTPSPVRTAPIAVDYAADPEFQQKLLAANQGDAEAQYELGMCYRTGKGAPENAEMALMWFRKAADQGHTLAHAMVFMMERD